MLMINYQKYEQMLKIVNESERISKKMSMTLIVKNIFTRTKN